MLFRNLMWIFSWVPFQCTNAHFECIKLPYVICCIAETESTAP